MSIASYGDIQYLRSDQSNVIIALIDSSQVHDVC